MYTINNTVWGHIERVFTLVVYNKQNNYGSGQVLKKVVSSYNTKCAKNDWVLQLILHTKFTLGSSEEVLRLAFSTKVTLGVGY